MIRKCAGSSCKLSASCWRFNCPESENQEWLTPKFDYNGICDYYFKFQMKLPNDLSVKRSGASRETE